MKLTELQPRWLSPDVFLFKNPTGGKDWLTCKRVVMTQREQMALVYEQHPDLKGQCIVLTVPGMAWTFEGNDFETMTVHPSIDASASGNWHGWIKNGEVS